MHERLVNTLYILIKHKIMLRVVGMHEYSIHTEKYEIQVYKLQSVQYTTVFIKNKSPLIVNNYIEATLFVCFTAKLLQLNYL